MAVDVGHGDKRIEEERKTREVSTEDDEDNQPQTALLIYKQPVSNQVPYLSDLFKPSTLSGQYIQYIGTRTTPRTLFHDIL